MTDLMLNDVWAIVVAARAVADDYRDHPGSYARHPIDSPFGRLIASVAALPNDPRNGHYGATPIDRAEALSQWHADNPGVAEMARGAEHHSPDSDASRWRSDLRFGADAHADLLASGGAGSWRSLPGCSWPADDCVGHMP